jgi:hypothetical protein
MLHSSSAAVMIIYDVSSASAAGHHWVTLAARDSLGAACKIDIISAASDLRQLRRKTTDRQRIFGLPRAGCGVCGQNTYLRFLFYHSKPTGVCVQFIIGFFNQARRTYSE